MLLENGDCKLAVQPTIDGLVNNFCRIPAQTLGQVCDSHHS